MHFQENKFEALSFCINKVYCKKTNDTDSANYAVKNQPQSHYSEGSMISGKSRKGLDSNLSSALLLLNLCFLLCKTGNITYLGELGIPIST